MDKAIAKLKKRFTEPSGDLIKQNPRCAICWRDFDADYRPVKLPCGHIFGKECIISWARGITPSGRYNSCPICRAELLPPTLHTRTSTLWQSLPHSWADIQWLLGGNQGVALVFALFTIICFAKPCSEGKVTPLIRIGTSTMFYLFMTMRVVRVLGWRREVVYVIAYGLMAIYLEECMEVFVCRRSLDK